jgi:hypothetical protein
VTRKSLIVDDEGLVSIVIPTIFDCCRPREDVLTTALGDYAAELRSVLAERGPNEYADPACFFANTYPTEGLLRLLEAAGRRLSQTGIAEGSTIRLDSTFGGGKTHGMIGLVHLARTPEAVPAEFLDPSLRPRVPAAAAAFDGEMANVVAGVDLEGGLRAKTRGSRSRSSRTIAGRSPCGSLRIRRVSADGTRRRAGAATRLASEVQSQAGALRCS